MKTTRRDFLEPIRNPSGLGATLRQQDVRLNRVERAKVKFKIENVQPPKKAPDVPGQITQVCTPVLVDFSVSDYDGGIVDVEFHKIVGSLLTNYKGVLVWIASFVGSGTPDIPTLTSDSTPVINWQVVKTLLFSGDTYRLTILQPKQSTYKPELTQCDQTFDIGNADDGAWGLIIIEDHALEIFQKVTNTGADSSPTATLSTFVHPDTSSTVIIAAANTTLPAEAVGDDLAIFQHYDISGITDACASQDGENLTPTLELGESGDWGAIALEISGCDL